MIEYVTRESATWAELPHKFEAGTVSACDAVGLGAAIRYVKSVGMENIEEYDRFLTSKRFSIANPLCTKIRGIAAPYFRNVICYSSIVQSATFQKIPTPWCPITVSGSIP